MVVIMMIVMPAAMMTSAMPIMVWVVLMMMAMVLMMATVLCLTLLTGAMLQPRCQDLESGVARVASRPQPSAHLQNTSQS